MNKKTTKRKEDYLKKLKDPRWQKKRLEILQRDDWHCRMCFDGESTLHVHHRYYINSDFIEPWGYPNDALVTLCENCHLEETTIRPDIEHDFLKILKRHFFYNDLSSLANSFLNAKLCHMPEVITSVLDYVLRNEEGIQHELIERYFDFLRKEREEKELLLKETSHGREVSDNNARGISMRETEEDLSPQ